MVKHKGCISTFGGKKTLALIQKTQLDNTEEKMHRQNLYFLPIIIMCDFVAICHKLHDSTTASAGLHNMRDAGMLHPRHFFPPGTFFKDAKGLVN